MGFLTTFTLYNDGLHLLKEYPEEFCEKLHDASASMERQEFGLGGFCNFANVQRTRHADAHTLYVHMGNTVTEVNPWTKEFEHLIRTHPDLVDAYIRFLEDTLQEMKQHRASIGSDSLTKQG
jgi:hypothetical protein